MSSHEIKTILRSRGWRMVDVAARWGHSVTWLSRLVNEPASRPAYYDDAFAGLPLRASVEVTREPRHKRVATPKQALGAFEMFPPGRIVAALDSNYAEEGTRFVVVRNKGGRSRPMEASFQPLVTLRYCDLSPVEHLDLPLDELILRFGDTGLEEPV